MSSLKQVEANRRNALKRTGPTTPEGRERSRRSAVRHGLTAETVIASLEDIDDYQAFEAAVTADYEAETAVERELVLRQASVLWRLRRATNIETGLFESVIAEIGKPEHPFSRLILEGGTDQTEQNQLQLVTIRQSDPTAGNEPGLNAGNDIGDCFMRLAELPTFPLDRLSRYKHTLWRQARQLVFTLESSRRRKRLPNRSSFPFSLRGTYSEKFK
jgi:hypothetical protein